MNPPPSTKSELTRVVLASAQNGTLVTPKHDPVSGSVAFPSFRTVVAAPVSSSLEAEIAAGKFDAVEYQNAKHLGPQYVVELTSAAATSVAQGFPSGSTTPSTQCDRLVFVDGAKGWHVYGESQARIDAQTASGALVRVGRLATS